MVAGEEEKSQNGNRERQNMLNRDCQMQYLYEKLYRLERMLSQKEGYDVEKNTEDILEGEKGAINTIPVYEDVKNREAFRKQIQYVEYSVEDYIRQISNFEQKLLRDENFMKKDYYQDTGKKLSILELYRNLQMLEENRKYFHEKPEKVKKLFQSNVGVKCERENHPSFGNFSHQELMYGHTCNQNHKYNSSAVYTCDKYEYNARLKNDRSKLNVSPEIVGRQAPFIKTLCSCHEMSSSSSDSEESFRKCVHLSKDQLNESCNYKEDYVESESSSEDQTTYSKVSKCTCYCSKDHSHDESSEAAESETDGDVRYEKKTKPERFRGGLDIINPKTRKVMEYSENRNEKKDYSASTNAVVDNMKLLKVEELREGLERLKIRNRNLRDFLDTLQNPINLMEKSSEANTVCTRVSSCYTFDVARQTRSGLLTVVEVLKGKCRNKDAVIIALADELKTGSDKKINALDIEKDKILMQDKSLVWNGLMNEKDNGRKFTKKDSAIGFVIFLMILISHVKKSEIISYLRGMKKMLTESPFKLSLFMNEAESFFIDFKFTYYQDFAYLFQSFLKYSLDRWANIALQFNQWIASYLTYFRQYFDIVNDFLIANQSWILFGICVIFVGILLINIKKIRVNRLISVAKCGKSYTFVKTFAYKVVKFVVTSKIFWFTLGFYSQILWNFIQFDFYGLLESLKIYYIKNKEHSLVQQLNETEAIIDNDCKLFDKFDYSWIMTIFCNKFQSFIEFACYILKNI